MCLCSYLSVALILNAYGTLNYDDSRTFEGRRIHISEVPFLVLVITQNHGHCTGFIIDTEWVVTAAHCFGSENFKGNVEVGIGTHDQLDESIKIAASSVIIHPDFYTKGREYDIALLHLGRKIKKSKIANIIQIEDKYWPKGNLRRLCYVVGYGYHIDVERIGVLHGGQVTTGYGKYPYGCKNAENNTKSKQFIWSNNNESVHICYGDSGAPLVCDRVAVGVAVISFNCGESESDIHCGGEYVDAFLYLHNHLEWLQTYVGCLPTSCTENIKFSDFGTAINTLNLSLYALIINVVAMVL